MARPVRLVASTAVDLVRWVAGVVRRAAAGLRRLIVAVAGPVRAVATMALVTVRRAWAALVRPVSQAAGAARRLAVRAWAPVVAGAQAAGRQVRRLSSPVAEAARRSRLVLKQARQSLRRTHQQLRAALRLRKKG